MSDAHQDEKETRPTSLAECRELFLNWLTREDRVDKKPSDKNWDKTVAALHKLEWEQYADYGHDELAEYLADAYQSLRTRTIEPMTNEQMWEEVCTAMCGEEYDTDPETAQAFWEWLAEDVMGMPKA